MQSKRGGARKGAGRKPAPDGTLKVPYSLKLDAEIRDYLRTCDNATDAIETAVRRSKAFRDWKRRPDRERATVGAPKRPTVDSVFDQTQSLLTRHAAAGLQKIIQSLDKG